MRLLIACLLVFLPIQLLAATAEPEQERDYSKLLDQKNVEFLRNLAMLLEAKGLKNVHIVPQMFVATATNSEGKEITVIVDYNTLNAFSIEGALALVEKARESVPETVVPQLH